MTRGINQKKTVIISNYKVYAYIVRHNYVLGGMLFTICKAQLHVSSINVGHLRVVHIVNNIPPNT